MTSLRPLPIPALAGALRHAVLAGLLVAAGVPAQDAAPGAAVQEERAQEETVQEALERCQRIEHGQPAEALELARALLARPEVDGDVRLQGRALGCRGWAEAQTGDTDAAQRTILEIDALLPQIEAPELRVPLMRRIAGLQQRTGRASESIEVLSEALALAEQHDLSTERVSLLVNLAIAHSEARNHDRAIAHYRTALDMLAENPDNPQRLPVLYNLGLTLRGADRLDEARDTFQQLIEPLQAPGMEIRLASLYSVLGSIEIERGDLEAAERILAESAALHANLDNPAERTALLIEWAELALLRDETEQALERARDALAEARRSDYIPSVRGALLVLSDAQIADSDFEGAVATQREYMQASDLFWREQLDTQLEEAEVRFGNERQARELAELRQANQEQDFAIQRQQLRQTIWFVVAAAVVLIAVVVFAWQRRNTRRLRRLSRTDPLTGLANRRQATDWLDELPTRTENGWSVIWLLDLDHFKRINDSHGHDSGDRSLVEVADLLRRFSTNHGARTARWGGEEFMLVASVASADEALRFAETLRRAVEKLDTRDRAGARLELTASIGFCPVAGIHRHSGQSDWEPALLVADQMLYRAKQAGRNRSYGLWPSSPLAEVAAHDLSAAVRSGSGRILEGPELNPADD